MRETWGDKNYQSINYFLREKFGQKVFKISLDGGFSCPNRDGTVSNGGCIFCSERGSGDFAGNRCFSISKQFEDVKKVMEKKWKAGKYIAYFQAYTNTYDSVENLRLKYEEALKQEGVVAIAIATRPDCLGEDVLDLLEELSKKVYVWVELGLQTINEETARVINRGYSLKTFEKGLFNLKSRGIDVVVHCIFGLPGETKGDMLNTIRYIARNEINGVKFHLLHLMSGTPLEKLYDSGKLDFLEEKEYVDLICECISILPQKMVVHRLTGDAPRELLIGPLWSLKKWETLNAIDKTLKEKNIYQGLYFHTNLQE
jgi:radical SAM protein (TIGR01212 family)